MTEEVTIGGAIFYIDRLDAFAQLEVMGDLQKDLLPAVGGLFGAISGEKVDDDGVADAISKLSQNLSGKQLKYWADRLLTADKISVETDDGVTKLNQQAKNLVFEDFTGIIELLYHVLRINFQRPLESALNRFGMDTSNLASLGLASGGSASAPRKSL